MKRYCHRTPWRRPGLASRMALVAALLLAVGTGVVWAGSATWNVDAAGSWIVTGNWNPATFPNAINDVASVNNEITDARAIVSKYGIKFNPALPSALPLEAVLPQPKSKFKEGAGATLKPPAEGTSAAE